MPSTSFSYWFSQWCMETRVSAFIHLNSWTHQSSDLYHAPVSKLWQYRRQLQLWTVFLFSSFFLPSCLCCSKMRQHLSTWVKLTSTFLCATLLFLGRRMELYLDYVRGWRLSVKINTELAKHRKHLKSCTLQPYGERPYWSPPTAGIQAQLYDKQQSREPGLLTLFGRVLLIYFSLCLFLSLSVSI